MAQDLPDLRILDTCKSIGQGTPKNIFCDVPGEFLPSSHHILQAPKTSYPSRAYPTSKISQQTNDDDDNDLLPPSALAYQGKYFEESSATLVPSSLPDLRRLLVKEGVLQPGSNVRLVRLSDETKLRPAYIGARGILFRNACLGWRGSGTVFDSNRRNLGNYFIHWTFHVADGFESTSLRPYIE